MRHIRYHQWASPSDFEAGTHDGTTICDGRLVIGYPATTRGYHDPHDPQDPRTATTYDVASWTSPAITPGFAFTELVGSWNTTTPPGTWVETTVRVVADDGTRSKLYSLGRWTMDQDTINRTSVPGQGDDLADVSIDVLVARKGRSFLSWELTVSLYRRAGTDVSPAVRLVGAVASALPRERHPLPPRVSGVAAGLALDVPTYSQELYTGKYTQFSGGGESWCSPTSTAMVLTFFGAGPTGGDDVWVETGPLEHAHPGVVHAAAHTYDWEYGAGNWPFNIAYASEFGMHGFVTRLRSLREAEQFIAAGIPLVASVSFADDQMAGAGYSTEGHLMVVVGFTSSGDVIVNDPASHRIASNNEVRMVYDRHEFRTAWLDGSGGVVYVIHPPDVPLPPAPEEANW